MNKICIHKPGNTTTIGIIVPIGAYFENDEIKGVSHFLEHMCFKGTKNRTVKEISSVIENTGGDLNAFTAWEMTAYWAHVSNKSKNLALDVINDLVLNPTFPKKEIDKERQVILQELNMYADSPKEYAYYLFNQTVYTKESGFYLPIIGIPETLNKISRSTLVSHYKKHYQNPTLIVVGNVENVISKSITYSHADQNSYQINENPERNVWKIKKDVSQANIIIGNSIKLSKYSLEEQKYMCNILCALYNDMSGRLFTSIREKNNLVYRVRFEWTLFHNGILEWQVVLGLNKQKINKAKELTIKELTRPISNKELEVATEKAIGTIAMMLDDPRNIFRVVGYHIIKNMDWIKNIYKSEIMLRSVKSKIKNFIKDINFNNYITVGVVPND